MERSSNEKKCVILGVEVMFFYCVMMIIGRVLWCKCLYISMLIVLLFTPQERCKE